jgi:hypothetical protein
MQPKEIDSQISIEKELLQYLTAFKSYSVPKCSTVIEVKVNSLGLLKYVFEKLLWFIYIFLELREDPFRISEHFLFYLLPPEFKSYEFLNFSTVIVVNWRQNVRLPCVLSFVFPHQKSLQ